ncbi:MAG TPA: hypothetical protein VG096_07170 [Bryobacteraceae bacterium]|nr:hypothetical protein [Bryobacteraceae bacterium]
MDFVPNQTFTFSQLTSLFATFHSNSGGSGGGTPRLVVDLVGSGPLVIYLGDSPAFTDSDAVLNTYSGFNVIGNNDPGRYDTSFTGLVGGSPSTTYSAALALVGSEQVLDIDYVTDTFGAFPSRDETLFSIGGGLSACVTDAYQLTYVPNLTAGAAHLDLTSAGTAGGVDPDGDICANVYVLAQDQQVIACCSCPLTPNHLKTLSAQDLILNTLTPGVPTAITVALVATANPTGGTCNASLPTFAALAPGMRAWGTRLHALPSGGFGVIENPFTQAAISASELNKLTSFCGFIQADGSQFGVCKACATGSAGAAKQ